MQPISVPARAILGTTPDVDSVIRRLEMLRPSPSATTLSAVAHRFEIVERLAHPHHDDVGDQPLFGLALVAFAGRIRCQSPSWSRANTTWPTISPAVRLRTSRCVPVWQNVQVSVQPTWLETHSVPRSVSGM